MSDNKDKQDGRDDSRIDANDASEISFAAKQFGVSADQIREAIEKVGNSREKVKDYLSEK
jgi:hypothetical protein